jgi:hypothetical protein
VSTAVDELTDVLAAIDFQPGMVCESIHGCAQQAEWIMFGHCCGRINGGILLCHFHKISNSVVITTSHHDIRCIRCQREDQSADDFRIARLPE